LQQFVDHTFEFGIICTTLLQEAVALIAFQRQRFAKDFVDCFFARHC
jgi:hypothetical protein